MVKFSNARNTEDGKTSGWVTLVDDQGDEIWRGWVSPVTDDLWGALEDACAPDQASPCMAETWSWKHFTPEQVDGYLIRCSLQGQHDEHKDEHTGLTWRTTSPKPTEVDGGR
jgi:hypothetical protein